MQRLIIEGGRRLEGEIAVHGAKNAVLPILAATLLGGSSTLSNCPALSDVDAAGRILQTLGCTLKRQADRISVDAHSVEFREIPETLMREMRSSILFLGPILARCGRARLSFPGGCELGARPIDLHIEGLRRLGAVISEEHGYLNCSVRGRLHGAEITLPFPSVGATETSCSPPSPHRDARFFTMRPGNRKSVTLPTFSIPAAAASRWREIGSLSKEWNRSIAVITGSFPTGSRRRPTSVQALPPAAKR